MNSAKHTPGPWEGDDTDCYCVWAGPEKNPTLIACALTSGDTDELDELEEDDPHPERYRQKGADIRLMAAAPDLLEALKMVLEATEYEGSIENIFFSQINEGIAKAEGGTA